MKLKCAVAIFIVVCIVIMYGAICRSNEIDHELANCKILKR